jgi:hypothetical protein
MKNASQRMRALRFYGGVFIVTYVVALAAKLLIFGA